MSQQQPPPPQSGLNPNAQAFIPNVQAAPFVPGQPQHMVITNPPPPMMAGQPGMPLPPAAQFMGAPPPGFPVGAPVPPAGAMPPQSQIIPPQQFAQGAPLPPPQQQQPGKPAVASYASSAAPPPSAAPVTNGVDNKATANGGGGGSSQSATPASSKEPTPSVSPSKKAPAKNKSPERRTTESPAGDQPPQPQQTTSKDGGDQPEKDKRKENGNGDAADGEAASSSGAQNPPTERDDWEDDEDDEGDGSGDDETPRHKPAKKTGNPDAIRREHINVVFIGHVDAGKSTIGGHIMYLTGMVDKRTLEKYEREAKEKNRESWYLSWALDTNAEEREKGKTVEVGRAFFETEKKHFTILDAPGHKSFVPNMIGGASQADLAVLVISARKGEFETGFERGGQTQEHAMLAKTAGIKHLIILVNKMDDPTVEWSQERYDDIRERLTPFLKRTGFNPKTDLTWIPCSGLTGANLKDRPTDPKASWYDGPCLIGHLDSLPSINRARDAPIRMVVVDKYSDMGVVVIGKVEAGVISKGQTILLMPNKTQHQVLTLWSDDAETDEVGPGENIKAKLKNIEEDGIMPGFTVCSLDSPCHVGRIFDAQVYVIECKSILSAGYSAVLHIHAAVEEITVIKLIAMVDPKSGKPIPPGNRPPKYVKQSQTCIMRLECNEMFCMERFKDFGQMGRFTLRDEGKTVAIGKVLKVLE